MHINNVHPCRLVHFVHCTNRYKPYYNNRQNKNVQIYLYVVILRSPNHFFIKMGHNKPFILLIYVTLIKNNDYMGPAVFYYDYFTRGYL